MEYPKETDWAYVAGMVDAKGNLNVYKHTSPSLRARCKNGRGYLRDFIMFIPSQSKELLADINARLGNSGSVHIYGSVHARKRSYTLHLYQNKQREFLPKLIPHLVLKKRLAQLMLEELQLIRDVKDTIEREVKLLEKDKEVEAERVKTGLGNSTRAKKMSKGNIQFWIDYYVRKALKQTQGETTP
jgi:hypothetical protein